MPAFHGIPVSDLSVFPKWMHEQAPVNVEQLRKGQRFVCFSSKGPGKTLILGEKHNAPYVYYVTDAETGERDVIGASAAAWPLSEPYNYSDPQDV